jgi:hypothetical protein
MQERAGDFHLPHLPAREVAHLVIRAFRQADAVEHVIGARPGLLFADTVQGRMIDQVLGDREIEVEGARLEHPCARLRWMRGRRHDRKFGCGPAELR